VPKFVGKFRPERDYENESRNKRNFERKKKQKQTQNAKRMAFYERHNPEYSEDQERYQK
jgi:hypothetical protein